MVIIVMKDVIVITIQGRPMSCSTWALDTS